MKKRWAGKIEIKFDPEKCIEFLHSRGYTNFHFFASEEDAKSMFAELEKPADLFEVPNGYLLVVHPDSESFLTEELVDEMAKHIGVLTGKWVLTTERDDLEDHWNYVRSLVPLKAPAAQLIFSENKKVPHVIRVFTKNYLDTEDVWRVRELLKKLQPKPILYKPDIHEILNLYAYAKSVQMESFGFRHRG